MNHKIKGLIPDLRFPEFDNSHNWTSYTLGEVSDFRRGSFPQPYGLPEWYDGENGMPFIQVYDVDNNFRLKSKTKNKISKLASLQSVFIKKGTVIITIQGSIGRVAITQYDAYIDRTLLIFQKFHKEIDKYFFSYVLFLLFEIEKEKAPGGIIKTITKEVLSDFVINIPTLPEQQKIASCLSSLDEIITAQKEKLELLKNHKKGLMQNLFPQEGEKIPKFRFPEFKNDGEWEEKTLGNATEIGRGKSKHRPRNESSLFGGIYPFIQTGDIRKANLYLTEFNQTYSEKGLQQSKIWDKDTLCITIAANIAETAILKIKACFPDSVIGIIPKKNICTILYVNYLIENFKLQIQSFSQGMAQDNLNQEKLSAITFLFPNIKEQQKIASCLSSLDELISSQTQKIEELQLHKKGLMQGLFPNITD